VSARKAVTQRAALPLRVAVMQILRAQHAGRAGAPRAAAPPRRWPEEHAKRAKEMQAKEARLRAILAQQRAERVQENSFRPSF